MTDYADTCRRQTDTHAERQTDWDRDTLTANMPCQEWVSWRMTHYADTCHRRRHQLTPTSQTYSLTSQPSDLHAAQPELHVLIIWVSALSTTTCMCNISIRTRICTHSTTTCMCKISIYTRSKAPVLVQLYLLVSCNISICTHSPSTYKYHHDS